MRSPKLVVLADFFRYLYRNEELLNECIDTAIEDNTFRADDLEFTFAARDWSERVDLGNMVSDCIHFQPAIMIRLF